jgi:hypothetical protein
VKKEPEAGADLILDAKVARLSETLGRVLIKAGGGRSYNGSV